MGLLMFTSTSLYAYAGFCRPPCTTLLRKMVLFPAFMCVYFQVDGRFLWALLYINESINCKHSNVKTQRRNVIFSSIKLYFVSFLVVPPGFELSYIWICNRVGVVFVAKWCQYLLRPTNGRIRLVFFLLRARARAHFWAQQASGWAQPSRWPCCRRLSMEVSLRAWIWCSMLRRRPARGIIRSSRKSTTGPIIAFKASP